MSRKIKLIWDFKGPYASKTAEHHLIHLNEFVSREKVDVLATGTENISGNHTIAFIACSEENMPTLRDQLRPHRGKLYMEN